MNRLHKYGYLIAALLALVSAPLQASFSDLTPPSSSNGEWAIEAVQESDNQAYFQAFQSSQAMLNRTLGWGWPTGKLTVEGNLDTMRYYVEQRQRQRSYTYVIRDAQHRRLQGALFVNPVQRRPGVSGFRVSDFDIEVTFWLNQAGQESEISDALIPQITQWFRDDWGVRTVLFPISRDNHYARQQLEQANLQFVADNSNNNEMLYRFRAR